MGCEHLTDAELLAAFENCTLPKERFHHADHVRLAWLYVGSYGAAEAETRFLSAIRRLAAHFGVPEKFHHTVTVAWVRLVASRYPFSGGSGQLPYNEWIASHPELLDLAFLSRFYSRELLNHPSARYSWREPDLQPLPEAAPKPWRVPS